MTNEQAKPVVANESRDKEKILKVQDPAQAVEPVPQLQEDPGPQEFTVEEILSRCSDLEIDPIMAAGAIRQNNLQLTDLITVAKLRQLTIDFGEVKAF